KIITSENVTILFEFLTSSEALGVRNNKNSRVAIITGLYLVGVRLNKAIQSDSMPARIIKFLKKLLLNLSVIFREIGYLK
ncbi:hypothetical protein OFM36_36130, partial [Escherichia coli]|nr:hypothetical protein [Escherichia coli]